MKSCYTLILIIALFHLSCSRKSHQPLEDQMEKVLARALQKYNERGASTAIINDDKLYTAVSGISHDTVSIKPDMLFAIGSVTKNVVAALTLKLVEENILSLEDPLSKWLPVYPHIDSSITIRQLLNHTSGIYMFWNNEKIWDDLKKDRAKVWTPEEVLSYIQEPHFAPGRGWRYSNTNYLLLAMIIEKATGSKLSTEFRKYFWKPLGISRAYLSLEDTIPDNIAHVFGDNFIHGNSESDLTYLPRASHESITFGSSGIFTTAENLALWSHSLFEGKILKPQSMKEMLQFIKFKPVSTMRAYGLGVYEYKPSLTYGKYAIGHGGGNIGTTTYMVCLPDYNASIVVMVSAFPSKSADAITKGLVKVVLKELNAWSILSYIQMLPSGLLIFYVSVFFIVIIVQLYRKKVFTMVKH